MTKKTGIIDIGSNSVRIGFFSDGKLLYKERIVTRLGEGLAVNGEMTEKSMDDTLSAVSEYARRIKDEGADKLYCFGTFALRSAKNGKELVKKIKDTTDIDVDIVSGDREAQLAVSGALGKNDGAVIDIGGGSTEYAVCKDGKIIFEKSLPLGAVTLTVMMNNNEEVAQYIDKTLNLFVGAPRGKEYFGIGGTISSLASMLLKLKVYDRNKTHLSVIYKDELKVLSEKIKGKSKEELLKEYCISEKRCEIIYIGSVLLLKIMEKLKIESLSVSESDNLEGYYLSLKQ